MTNLSFCDNSLHFYGYMEEGLRRGVPGIEEITVWRYKAALSQDADKRDLFAWFVDHNHFKVAYKWDYPPMDEEILQSIPIPAVDFNVIGRFNIQLAPVAESQSSTVVPELGIIKL